MEQVIEVAELLYFQPVGLPTPYHLSEGNTRLLVIETSQPSRVTVNLLSRLRCGGRLRVWFHHSTFPLSGNFSHDFPI